MARSRRRQVRRRRRPPNPPDGAALSLPVVDGLGPIRPFLGDDDVSEVLVNGPGPVWVERFGTLHQTDVNIGRQELELLIERILVPLGLRVDRTAPIVDARMADGSRVNVVVPPLCVDGPSLSIRRFGSVPVRLPSFGPPDMTRTLTGLMADGASILVVGPTSSGKTTLINALSLLTDPQERIVCIEDTAELQLAGTNIVRLEARPANSEGVGEVSMRQLVLAALRMRPDRLVVGEVRGAEAFDLLLALTSGHRGCLTSCHAADAPSGLRRLETLASLAGSQIGSDRLRRLIADGLDAIVTMERADSRRQVRSIVSIESGRLITRWSAPSPDRQPPPLPPARPLEPSPMAAERRSVADPLGSVAPAPGGPLEPRPVAVDWLPAC